MEMHLAVDNVCAWPNIKRLPNGEVIAVIFNQPCHLLWEGTIECQVSSDSARTWQLRSCPVINAPGTNRGNVAVGLNNKNEIVVLCGGWDKAAPAPDKNIQGNISDDRIKYQMKEKNVLLPVCSVSKDNGRTWQTNDISVLDSDIVTGWVPFGDIILLDNGNLACSMYAVGRAAEGHKQLGAFFCQSEDNGTTWKCLASIAKDGNETAMIKLPNGKILAAVRKQHLDLYESTDDGRHWRFVQPLTAKAMYPASFTLLDDGHLLLTYGIRHRGLFGVGAMTMHLQSETWNTPMLIANFGDAYDGGYPSSVQLDNGEIVTAYYCSPTQTQKHYHLGVVIWRWKEFSKTHNMGS